MQNIFRHSGWEPVILTVDPEYAAYPAIDNSLSNEVSPDLKVYRTRATDWFRLYKKDKSKIPSAGFATNDNNSLDRQRLSDLSGEIFLFPIQEKDGINMHSEKHARLIETEEIKHIITTSPPHSTQLIGLKLKKKYPGIKWIADLRDPWTDIYYYDSFYHTPVARKIDANYEKKVLENADRIITVGKSLKDSFVQEFQGLKTKLRL